MIYQDQGLDRVESDPSIQLLRERLSQRSRISPIQSGIGNALIALGGGKPNNTDNDLGTKIALLNYRNSLAKDNESYKQGLKTEIPEGYGSETEIPKTMVGLPLEGVTSKGGRLVPTYKNVAQGGTGTNAQGQPLNYDFTGPEFLAQLSPEDQNIIKGLTNYTIDPIHTFGGMKGAQRREHMMAMASQVDPEFNSSEYNARYKYNQDLRAGKGRQNILSLNTATKHLQSLDDSMKGLAGGSFPILNKVENWWKRSNGDPAPAEVDTALNAVAGELATVFKNSSGTDQEIGHWLKTFDPNGSHEQKKAFINQAIELMQGRLGAMEDQYTSTMGHEPPQNAFISPSAMEIMNKLKDDKTPALVAGVGNKTDYSKMTDEELRRIAGGG